MNRCQRTAAPGPSAALSVLSVLVMLAALACPPAVWAQTPDAVVQNEATAGGRNFPEGTLRGQMMVLAAPEIQLDGRPDRLSPGARIRSAENMVVTTGAVTGQNLLVNYTRDPAGLVREVWILTATEASAKRVSAGRPFLNFWPFVAASGATDDGKTPFNQLPAFGQ
ncbi:hypothetical protein [Variovorax sp. ZT4R33]|uniref:hypothetical protein n=1 Tax=Variovorax sp. ZT4R33 TaxID=3443743 RepID=UPI003F456E75